VEVYSILICLIKILYFYKDSYGKEKISLYKLFFDKVFLLFSQGNEPLAQMFLALFNGFLFMTISYLFYLKKWFIKI